MKTGLAYRSAPLVGQRDPAFRIVDPPTDLSERPQGVSKTWKFRLAEGEIEIAPSARLRSNDAESIRAAVLAGLGMAQGPSWMFAGEIVSGALVSVLADYKPRLFPIHAVSSETRRMTGAIKALVDFVAGLIKDELRLAIR